MAQRLINSICEFYALPKMKLRVRSGMPERTWAWADYEAREVAFNRWKAPVHPIVVVHEMAHMVVTHYFTRRAVEDHGREFCGVFMLLLNEYDFMPSDALKVVFRRHGVKWRPTNACTPEALAKVRG
jgi:hypothetical protein